MTTVTPSNPSVLFQKTPAKNTSNPSPAFRFVQTPHFSGDAYNIRQELKEKLEEKQKRKAHFKAICNTVVYAQGEDTLTIGEMVAFLCRIRKNENYPGYGTVETLAKDFPGMNIEALRQGFEKLHDDGDNSPSYLGKGYGATKYYWLRPFGEKMIKELYPEITFPSEEELFTLTEHTISGDIPQNFTFESTTPTIG